MGMPPMRRFWKLLKQYQKEIRQIYAYALFIGIVNLTLPLGIQAIINFLQTGEYTTTWLILVGFVLVGITITGIIQVLQLRIVENIQQDLFTRSALEFAYRIPKISFIQLDKIHAPELVNRFFDTLTIQKGLPKILIDFSLAAFQIIFGLTLLAVYSPYFIVLGFSLAIILWIIFKFTGPQGLTTSLKESKYKYQLAYWLEEIARVNTSFKLFSKNKFHLNKTDDIVEGYLVSREKHFQVLISQFRLFIGFKVIVAAGLLLLGGYLVFQERMNIGQFVAAEIIIILIINSIEKILRIIDTIYDVLTALDKIGYITDIELDKKGGNATVITEQGLSLRAKEIVFGFPDDKNKIIDKVSFEINANDKVLLTGESGSGKSILLKILSGIHEIEEGQLYIDDVPFINYEMEKLYENFGVSFPTNQIFEGSFKDNIVIGRNISDREISETLKLLNLDDYLIHQPQGVDSFVDSGGRRLPRSIIQKLLVARIIIGKPKLLLMEDPLLFIEEDEKRKIIDYIMDEKRDWTVLVISDFYYWKEKCNKVINLNKN
ncbi:peptidase domain-containing ABC transporter [Portibacter lacus]|uniref:ABC transporter ATP-binding protein n=1 Tax=Portibacter lacus TaxID=1099794 RepID=A0AA37WF53_9BACT|nr:ABC transporter ATP-binding protein [Portibacter lacus]GLR19541.1 ABC transporter ATP-binding protein [Portibacter lacus]